MALITLTKQRTSDRNGMTTYKVDNQRSTGSVYFDKKMFPEPEGAPETITVEAQGIQVPTPKPVPAPKAEAQPAPEAVAAQA